MLDDIVNRIAPTLSPSLSFPGSTTPQLRDAIVVRLVATRVVHSYITLFNVLKAYRDAKFGQYLKTAINVCDLQCIIFMSVFASKRASKND